MVIVLVINLFTTRIVLQALGVEDYGVYNVVCGFVAMFGFLNTSMSNGIQRFFNYEFGKNGEEGANKVYCTAIYIQATLAIVVVVLIEVFGLWYLHNKMVIPLDRMAAAELRSARCRGEDRHEGRS
jgi:O-antigen/teichoic acid export membrane protein